MKKVALILAVAMSIVGLTNSYAQQDKKGKSKGEMAQKSPEEMASKRSEMWKKELGLSDEQTGQMKTAISERITKIGAAKVLTDKVAKKDAMAAAKTEYDAKVKTILTPEQSTKFTAKKEEMKKKNADKKGAPAVEDLD